MSPFLRADGLLYHALNRGNNRGPVFFAEEDYRSFLKALAQTQARYPFRLYGYCLMTNHFHLLLQPADGVSISRVLQSLTEKELAAVRRSVTSGRPYGEAVWARGLVQGLGLRFSERGRGRPRKQAAEERE